MQLTKAKDRRKSRIERSPTHDELLEAGKRVANLEEALRNAHEDLDDLLEKVQRLGIRKQNKGDL